MKGIILSIAFLFSGLAFASEVESLSEQRISTCGSWKYSIDARGYVCNYTSNIRIYDAYYVDDLVRRIEALENRIEELEAKK